MSASRRRFLGRATAGAAALWTAPWALGSAARPRRDDGAVEGVLGPAAHKKRILILGGTGQIGPYQVRYAVARGHDVTIFNRGRRQADLPEGITWLRGDRSGDLEALKGKRWDVVIDNPTSLPVWVRDVGEILAEATDQYLFVSTLSVYADDSQVGADEEAPLHTYRGEDALAETMDSLRADMGLYGPLKAACEAEAQRWFGERTTVVRPGLIVGAGDTTDRFTYWPVRVARGGEVLAPPAHDPVQFIDARDLGEWMVRLAENGTTGTFNAMGPAQELSVAGLLWSAWAVTGGDARFTHPSAEFLAAQGVRAWADLPAWVPGDGPTAGFSRRSNRRALAAGLSFRPLAETIGELLEWHAARPEAERGPRLRAGIDPAREAAVLAAWRAVGR